DRPVLGPPPLRGRRGARRPDRGSRVGRRVRVRHADAIRERRRATEVFLDLAGELWQQGKLIDKVATSFTSSQTSHGGQESTILALNNTLYHWGAIVLPLGYTIHEVFNGGGNPYGASFTSGHSVDGPDEQTQLVARGQGARLARVAA